MTLLELRRTFWYAVKAIREGQYHRAEAAYWDVVNALREERREERKREKARKSRGKTHGKIQ